MKWSQEDKYCEIDESFAGFFEIFETKEEAIDGFKHHSRLEISFFEIKILFNLGSKKGRI